jgi:selenocysteine lyase/cysteine desulfurase
MDSVPRRPASYLISLWIDHPQSGLPLWRGALVTAADQRLHFSTLAELNRLLCELAGWLIEQLLSLRHSNGNPVIRLYGPPNTYMRGGTIQVNFFDPEGTLFDCKDVERMANSQRISLRAGCHCNPGAREVALDFTREELAPCFRDKERLTFEQFLQGIDGKTTGALRASIGLVTTFADVYKYMQFAETFADRHVGG